MADQTHYHSHSQPQSSGNAGMAFILGVVVVILAVLAWAVFGGLDPQSNAADESNVTVTIDGAAADAANDAGRAIEGAAQSLGNAAENAAGALENAASGTE